MTTATITTTTTTITACRLEVRRNNEGMNRLPGHHHKPAPTSNCLWGGLEPGNERRADDGYDMDMTRTMGSARNGENELQDEQMNRGNEALERAQLGGTMGGLNDNTPSFGSQVFPPLTGDEGMTAGTGGRKTRGVRMRAEETSMPMSPVSFSLLFCATDKFQGPRTPNNAQPTPSPTGLWDGSEEQQ